MQTQPVEDIDAVLGRFQAWAGSRNAVETKPGIRELSYEEALQSRRYRRNAAGETPAKRPGVKLGAEPGVVPVAAPDAVARVEPGPLKKSPVKARDAERKPVKKVRGRHRAAKTAATSQASPAAVKAKPAPEFREALANAVRSPEVVLATMQPVELTRQVAVSIRLAPAERALMKTRAAEAGITISAYMRQCALEVEQLRAQVQQTLAAMERNAPVSVSSPVSAPGFFARLARRLLRVDAPALVLRA